MKKNENGITLIALVVTIIVLLILAGVSIAMITGDNGILGRARETTWKSKLGEAEDMIGLEVTDKLTAYLTGEDTETYTSLDDVIVKGCASVLEKLNGKNAEGPYAIATDKQSTIPTGKDRSITKIKVTYTVKSKPYYVLGTLKDGSEKVDWGNPTATDPDSSCNQSCDTE